MNVLHYLDRALGKRTPNPSVRPGRTHGARIVAHHPAGTPEQDHRVPPDPDTETFLYEAAWQRLLQPGVWHIDRLSLNGELEIQGWVIRPEHWFGEATFTVNGRPFTNVERDGDRPDVVSVLRAGKDRVSGFRCRIDAGDIPEGMEDLRFAYADRRTLTPLATPFWHFPGVATPLPESARRTRVHGMNDETSFVLAGAQNYGVLVHAIDRAFGKTFDDFPCVLDWGCGSGRVLRYVAARHRVNLAGVDIDADNIEWCKTAFPACSFQAIDLDPPLPLAASSVDIVYGISVFTHLTENDQFKWLDELRRIVRPGGVLLFSLHGDHSWFRARGHAPRSSYAEWKRRGFLDAGNDPILNGFIPDADYYRDVFHDFNYVLREWSRFFRVVEYLPGVLQFHQDLVVLLRE